MSRQSRLLAPFSENWAEVVEGTANSIGGRVSRSNNCVATDVGRPAGLQNCVVLLEPLHLAAVASLMTTLESFFAFGTANEAGTVYLFSVWPVPDLAGYGWEYVGPMPLMMRPSAGAAPASPSALQIVPVRSVTDLQHFEHVIIAGFPLPELLELPPGSAFGSALLHDPRYRFWVGFDNGLPVAASAAYIAHGLVDLIFLATLPQARGRGFGSALAWTATLTDPALPAMLMASEDGQSLYTRIGYQHLCEMPLWKRDRP